MGVSGTGRFPPTRWSAILGLRSADGADRARSFDALVEAYWKPVYKTIRLRWRKSTEEAKDLTQEFFLQALEKEFFVGYDPSRARFRTFLRTCLDRFLANEAKAEGRLKRGGGAEFVSLDFDVAESELAIATVDSADVDRAFERDWARSLLELAVRAFREECAANGRDARWRVFERYDLCETHEARPTYEDLAREIGVPATTITNHLAAARRELRRIVLEKLRSITANEEEFRDEARVLLGHDVAEGN